MRAGGASLIIDICTRLHAEKNVLLGFVASVIAAQAAVTGYLISKTGQHTGVPPAATASAATGGTDHLVNVLILRASFVVCYF